MTAEQNTAARPRNTALAAALESVDASREAERQERERHARRLDMIEQELTAIPRLHQRLSELERRVERVDKIDAGVFDSANLGDRAGGDRPGGGGAPRADN